LLEIVGKLQSQLAEVKADRDGDLLRACKSLHDQLTAKDAAHTAELEALRERAAKVAEDRKHENAVSGTLCTMAAASTLIAKTIRALPLSEKEACR